MVIQFPRIPADLLERLEQEFPNNLSHLLSAESKSATQITLEKVQRALGQQEVMQVLRNHYRKQQDSVCL